MHPLHDYVANQLADKIKFRRVVVWYDERGEFRPFVGVMVQAGHLFAPMPDIIPEIIDRHFSLGAHLNARDRKAVRKTVSGLMKILFPHGEVTRDELGELLELALEGRRRVKEQLKKMGSFESYHTRSAAARESWPRRSRPSACKCSSGSRLMSSSQA